MGCGSFANRLPSQREAARLQEQLAEQRADRDAEVERERIEAQRLAGAARRSKVGQDREAGDEEERLGSPQHESQTDEQRQVAGDRVARDRQRAEERAADE